MKNWVVSCFCVVLTLPSVACTGIIEGTASSSSSGASGTGGEAPTAPTAPNSEPFAQCAACHGPTGEGSVLGYEIRHPVRPYAAWVVRHGRTGGEFPSSAMLAYGGSTLSDEQLTTIFDYLDGFPQPLTGQDLYLDYCGNCHGTDARGGVTGVDISDKAFNDALEKVREGEGGNDYGNRGAYMPAFPRSKLTDDEVELITDYISTL